MLKTLLTFWQRKSAAARPAHSSGYALSILDLQLREATTRLPAARRALAAARAGEAMKARHLALLERKLHRQEVRLLHRLGGRGGAAAQAAIVAGLEQQRRATHRCLQVLRGDVSRLGQGIAADEARIDELRRCRRLTQASFVSRTQTSAVKLPAFAPPCLGLPARQRPDSGKQQLGIKILF